MASARTSEQRRDVILTQDDVTGHFWVEAREGGTEGNRMRQEYDCEPDALRSIARLTADTPVNRWQRIPGE